MYYIWFPAMKMAVAYSAIKREDAMRNVIVLFALISCGCATLAGIGKYTLGEPKYRAVSDGQGNYTIYEIGGNNESISIP